MTSPFVGSWSYRSFQNNPDLAVPFDALRFGAGTLALTEPAFGQVSGTLGAPGWSLTLAGHYTYGNPNHARFQGSGDIDGERWVYDYVGYLVPAWPNGVNQTPAIVGSVIAPCHIPTDRRPRATSHRSSPSANLTIPDSTVSGHRGNFTFRGSLLGWTLSVSARR